MDSSGTNSRRVVIGQNMLSPYWHPVFDQLSNRGWDVHVLVATAQEPNREYEVPDYEEHSFSVHRSRSLAVDIPGTEFRTHVPYGIWADLYHLSPDVIVTAELGPRTILSLAYGSIFGVPVIPWVCVSPHTERHNTALKKAVRRLLLRHASAVWTNKTEAQRYLTDILHVPEKKIFSTPYTVDVDRYVEVVQQKTEEAKAIRSNLKLREVALLYVGQMIERKGLLELARGVRLLRDTRQQQLSLVFVGGSLPNDVKAVLDETNIQVREIGFLQPDDLPTYYALADGFILPTLEDEWGIVLNEAAAAGLPLLSSKYAGATTDLVNDGENGFVFDPHVQEEVKNAVRKLVTSNPDQRTVWGRRARQMAKKVDISYTVLNMIKSLRLVY